MIVSRLLLALVALTLSQWIGGTVMVALFGPVMPATPDNFLPWQIATNILYVLFFGWFALRSKESGWRLGAAMAILLLGIEHITGYLEAFFFGLFTLRQFFAALVMAVISVLLFVPAFVYLFRRYSRAPQSELGWTARITFGRIVAGAFAYLLAYFAAGIIIYPYVRWFYEGIGVPQGPGVILMQLFVRGPLFVVFAALIIALSRAPRFEIALMIGAAMAILGGSGLMQPNPFFPDSVRWTHFFEVTSSNFLYGCFLGWLLTRRRSSPDEVTEPQAVLKHSW